MGNVQVEARTDPRPGQGSSRSLRDHGLDAEPENEVGIVVANQDGDGEVYSTVEDVIMQIGAHFVPIKHEDASSTSARPSARGPRAKSSISP